MKAYGRKSHAPPGTRRYLIHLSCAQEENTGHCRYVLRIQLWKPRSNSRRSRAEERFFEDELALAEAVNPLLPGGADVRNVLSYVESAEGFLYLLHLNPEQAKTLGWRA